MSWFASLFLGASLAACTGLRAFLPLLVIALVSRYRVVGYYSLPEGLEWLQSDPVLTALAVLALAEVAADKLRLVANLVDPVLVLLRPGAGVLACLAVLNLPVMAANLLAAVVVGLTLSLPIMSLKGGSRMLGSRHATGFVSPGVSLAEDLLAAVGPVAAFFSPVLVFMLILAGSFYLLTRVRLTALRRKERPAPPPAGPGEGTGPTAGYGPPTPGLRRRG